MCDYLGHPNPQKHANTCSLQAKSQAFWNDRLCISRIFGATVSLISDYTQTCKRLTVFKRDWSKDVERGKSHDGAQGFVLLQHSLGTDSAGVTRAPIEQLVLLVLRCRDLFAPSNGFPKASQPHLRLQNGSVEETQKA